MVMGMLAQGEASILPLFDFICTIAGCRTHIQGDRTFWNVLISKVVTAILESHLGSEVIKDSLQAGLIRAVIQHAQDFNVEEWTTLVSTIITPAMDIHDMDCARMSDWPACRHKDWVSGHDVQCQNLSALKHYRSIKIEGDCFFKSLVEELRVDLAVYQP
ncbi:hypothetical protein K438DRAFT_1767488 [Mycena galopus ATCC 62051]|nr:hypothetical protein K438DRAFT_1767488 [Mycena galopus ATCC 62051]